MNIRPLHDRVIVKRVEAERTTASGIVLPDSAGEKPDQGEVLAVGPGKRDDNGKQIALDVKVGDRVLFGKYAGQAVKVDGQEVLVMREEDIMGVLVEVILAPTFQTDQISGVLNGS
jgi:chaperonin GroES